MEKVNRQGDRRPAELTFVTADLQQDTGGELKTLKGLVLMQRPNSKMEKNHSHDFNGTRNFFDTINQRYLKIHPILILKFNGKEVLL